MAASRTCKDSVPVDKSLDWDSGTSSRDYRDHAAVAIQDAFRQYLLNRRFFRLRSEEERESRLKRLNDVGEGQGSEEINVGEVQPDHEYSSGNYAVFHHTEREESHKTHMNTELVKAVRGLAMIDETGDCHDMRATKPSCDELSDSGSDADDVVAASRSAFDESSAVFESLLEADESEARNDSFNSSQGEEDDGDVREDEAVSRTSTLRPGSACLGCANGNCEAERRGEDASSAFVRSIVFGDTVVGYTPVRRCSSSVLEENPTVLRRGNITHRTNLSPVWKRKSVRLSGSTGSLSFSSSSSEVSSRFSGVSNSDSMETGGSDSLLGNSEDGSSFDSGACAVPVTTYQRNGSLCRDSPQITRGVVRVMHCKGVNPSVQPVQGCGYNEGASGSRHDVGLSLNIPTVAVPVTRVSDSLRKRIYRVGLNLFNKKPEQGVQYLITQRFIDDRPNAVARFLVSRKGLSKQMIGEYLGNIQNEFNMQVLRCFCNEMDLTGMQVDVALRRFQSYFRMPGEAQKIEKLMESFAGRYTACNADVVGQFHSRDTVFLLAFAIVMLNTDRHNRNVRSSRKMTLPDFVKNLRGVDGGSDIDYNLLAGIYSRILEKEFEPGSDHVAQVTKVEQLLVGKFPKLAEPHRRLVCYCRLLEISDIGRRERSGAHQREVFLFNDLLLVTKLSSKKKDVVCYNFRNAFPLSGMAVYLFETPYYKYGIRLNSAVDDHVLITLYTHSEHDRTKFIEDLKEAILEIQELETVLSGRSASTRAFSEPPGSCSAGSFSPASSATPGCSRANRISKDSGVMDVEHMASCAVSDYDVVASTPKRPSSPGAICEHMTRNNSGGSVDSGRASSTCYMVHSEDKRTSNKCPERKKSARDSTRRSTLAKS